MGTFYSDWMFSITDMNIKTNPKGRCANLTSSNCLFTWYDNYMPCFKEGIQSDNACWSYAVICVVNSE